MDFALARVAGSEIFLAGEAARNSDASLGVSLRGKIAASIRILPLATKNAFAAAGLLFHGFDDDMR